MKEDQVFFLTADNRNEAIQALVNHLHKEGIVPDPEAFYQAILDREKLVSTGIGMGVALPHAKMDTYPSFFIAIGILSKGVNWNSIDHAPVRLIFLIGGPSDKQTEYLQILSHLTQVIKNEEVRKKLLTINSKDTIINLFVNSEKK